ncbi:FMN-binding protein [Thermosipho melanesiensis]|uniref:FMN-binding domain protein n=2 Tax=Thermosipho melanesiensis TaxID=46541 RepID=A6LKR4_THEM4|nr:FMN-binding protein [Thermosipho melanesiensis]ABR30515.1 FMN-binding domain protein [Thermosipho melanesiensis BI429]APT73666.1 FMN-binding protein [Thermosipho melanesiensis]OOC35606.1 FMN-binding protein [Thermosipho melanesiensis]OOC39280.1 FMN-binding protein [Thermosipho melanesiensis]OOC39366.1 FMN-binding protein [Thermosipho melanesiensis]
MKTDNRFYVVLFTFTVTFLFVLVLSYINYITTGKVKTNEEFLKVRAILNAAGINFNNEDEAILRYEKSVSILRKAGNEFYVVNLDGKKKVYVYIFSGNGLWGTITGAIALDENVEKIVGIDIISQNETPGLGGRIEEDWFKEQFRGKKIDKDLIVQKSGKNGGIQDYKVDAITGATLTSKFFVKVINDTIKEVRDILRGDQNE